MFYYENATEKYDSIKLEIYEAYDNGEISYDEKEYLLEENADDYLSNYSDDYYSEGFGDTLHKITSKFNTTPDKDHKYHYNDEDAVKAQMMKDYNGAGDDSVINNKFNKFVSDIYHGMTLGQSIKEITDELSQSKVSYPAAWKNHVNTVYAKIKNNGGPLTKKDVSDLRSKLISDKVANAELDAHYKSKEAWSALREERRRDNKIKLKKQQKAANAKNKSEEPDDPTHAKFLGKVEELNKRREANKLAAEEKAAREEKAAEARRKSLERRFRIRR